MLNDTKIKPWSTLQGKRCHRDVFDKCVKSATEQPFQV